MDRLLEAVKQGNDVRASLIEVKQRLKNPGDKEYFRNFLTENPTFLVEFLGHEDPKVRKNAALIIGELRAEEMTEELFGAYIKEETLFIRSDYLKALQKLPFQEYQQELKQRLIQLTSQEIPQEKQKHYRDEISLLQRMLIPAETKEKRQFTGFDKAYDVILTTNKKYREITARQVQGKRVSLVPLGVKVQGANLPQILEVRTFREVLFVLNTQTIGPDPVEAAAALAASDLEAILQRAHGAMEVCYFRIGLTGKMPLDKRSSFIKKCSFALEQCTNRRLVNTPSDYEVEIRLLERMDGTFLPLIKLFTLKEERFGYRKESVAASIQPWMAALTAALTKPYLKEEAQVLDPFCGVGTMLLERDKAVEAGPMYGIDIYGEAIAKARENSKLAQREIYYINRDFFDFTHEYLFDEIFTNMPLRGKKTKEEQELFYQRFFQKAAEVLKKDGIMILYSNEKGYIKKQIRLNENWKLLNEYELEQKNDFAIYVIGRRG